jgi:protein-tyrosine-phosphatase
MLKIFGRIKMLKVLFLCTQNSARSQMAEAILNSKSKGRILALSAGIEPTESIYPLIIPVMKEVGIDISDAQPKSIEIFSDEIFDFVITLCDRAKNQCPTYFNNTVHAHWGIEDPRYIEGTEEQKLRQIEKLKNDLIKRIDLFLALPLEKSDKVLLKQKLNSILSSDNK